MWDLLRVGPIVSPFNKTGLTPPPTRKGIYGSSSNNNSFDSWTGTYSYSIEGGPAPAPLRPPHSPLVIWDDELNVPPPLQQPPPRNPGRSAFRDSTFRPTSSIYSQPSPSFPAPSETAPSRPYINTDISPPSSPDIASPENVVNPNNISPIDEAPPDMSQLPAHRTQSAPRPPPPSSQPQQQQQQQSGRGNIPMMRRERRKNQDAAANTLRETRSREMLQTEEQRREDVVRWDTLSGERTNSETGRPSQVKPAEYARGLGISGLNSPASPGSATSKNPATMFGERVKRFIPKPSGGDKGRKPALGGPASDSNPAAPSGNRVPSNTDPAAAAFTSNRPEWRGASGRTALVAPVKDTPDVQPLEIPRKSSKRMASGGALRVNRGQTPPVSPPSAPETGTGSGPPLAIRQVVPSSQLQSTPIDGIDATRGSAQSSYPSPPLSGNDSGAPQTGGLAAINSSLPLQHSPATATFPASNGTTSNSSEKSPAAIRRKPPPAHQNQSFGHTHVDSVSSVYSQDSNGSAPRPPPHGTNPTSVGPTDNWAQPASRFSVTTYAPSTRSSQHTPRESLDEFDPNITRPPMPPTPSQFLPGGGNDPQGSVLDRKRPKFGDSARSDGVYDSSPSAPIVISLKNPHMSSPYGNASGRKAVGSGTTTNPSAAAVARARTNPNPSSRPASIMSTNTNKDLPAPPPETTAGAARDRVALLNAQLSSLGNRRINLTRSIKQMTELMPTDGLMVSAEVLHKRELEKRKVETLREELADVQRQEYELGLKLHRAYKRMDREAEWEGTALWVRRVTE